VAAPQYPGNLGRSQNVKPRERRQNWLAQQQTRINKEDVGEQKENFTAEMAPLTGTGVEERVQVMAFADDLAVIPEHVPGESTIPDKMTLQYTDSMAHSIISFLERPQLISCFAWSGMSIDKHGQNILAMQDPSDASKTILNPLVPSQVMTQMFIEKLQGFTAFRATAVFKLQINSQNFQAGRLIFGVVPMPGLLKERADFIVKTPCSALSVNHVQMDINKQTEVILRVPFISPFNSYDLINQQYDWGRLFCIVYGPLNVVGDDNRLQCDLYCHFEDIELGCPTSAKCTILPCFAPNRVVNWSNAQSQSGKVNYNKSDIKKFLEEKRLKKLKSKLRESEINFKYNEIPRSQSGRVKGNLVSNGSIPPTSKTGKFLEELTGDYYLEIYANSTASNFNTAASVNFNFVNNYSLFGNLVFSGIVTFQSGGLFYDNNTNGFSYAAFKLDSIIPTSDTGILVTPTNSIPFWITDIDPSPPALKPMDVDILPVSQSGKGRFTTARKTTKQPRAPPKEASPRKIEQKREEEADGVFARAVKGFAGKVGNAATAIGDVVAQIGNWLGWSKPQIDYSGNTVVIRPCQYFGNANGIDHSHVLSLDLMNNIDQFPELTGTDLDELSFDFLKRIPQFIGAFQYNAKNTISFSPTDVGNDYLWSCFVLPNYINPACFKYQYTGTFGDETATASNILDIQNPTSLGYICSPFTYWTGSLVYTFRFVKTNYNSGRIEISYHPFLYSNKYGTQNIPTPDNQRFQYAYRVVVDLRDNSEVSLTIPYISPQQWKALSYYNQKWFINPPKDPAFWEDLELDELARCSTGILWVRALTPLHTQSTVAPTSVLCLVECRAGDDFQVQCPSVARYIPLTTTAQSQSGKVYATAGTAETRTRALEGFIPPSITGIEADIEQADSQMYCAGEIFENFRQYIKRNCFVRTLGQLYSNEPVTIYTNDYIIPPRIKLNIYSYTPPGGRPVYYQIFKLPTWPSPMSFVSSMYCFYKGGVRFKIFTTTSSGSVASGLTSMRLLTHPYTGKPGYIAPTNRERNSYNSFCSPIHYEQSDKHIAEFQVPYYSPTLQSCPWSIRGGYLYDNPLPYLALSNSNITSSSYSRAFFHIATSASDDFDLGLFLGAPLAIKTEVWQQSGQYTSGKGYPYFSNLDPYDNIATADPCYTAAPFADGKVPTGAGEMVKISTFDLDFSLANLIVSNPDLTVTTDPAHSFNIGC